MRVKKIIAVALTAVTLATSFSLSPVANTAITVEAKASEQGHTKKVTMQRKHMVGNYGLDKNDAQAYTLAMLIMTDITKSGKSKVVLDPRNSDGSKNYNLAKTYESTYMVLNTIYFRHYPLGFDKGQGLSEKRVYDPLDGYIYITTINLGQARKLYKKNQQIEDKLQSIIKACGITANTTEYEAVKQFNKWIANNIKYDHSLKSSTTAEALTTGKTICMGYADLFQTLCDYVGIECYKVCNYNHEWNIVSVDGVLYHIDTCWNAAWKDADIEKWFILSESEILKDHSNVDYDDERTCSGSRYSKRYEMKFYTISYNLNGGKNNELNPTHYYTINNKAQFTNLKASTKKGYTFKGWYSNGKKITNLKQVVGTNPTLTAKWEKVSKPALKNVKLKKTETATNTTLKITWKKAKNTRYEVKYKVAGSKEKTKTTTKNTITLKITAGKKYKVTVRAYKLDSANKKVYSKAKTFTGK